MTKREAERARARCALLADFAHSRGMLLIGASATPITANRMFRWRDRFHDEADKYAATARSLA